jgi:hypothetical protein
MAVQDIAQSAFAVTIYGNTDTVIMDNDDVRELYFIEDIYSYLKSGCLLCRDARGLAEFLPLVGNEKISIVYGTHDGGRGYVTKKLWFDIIKIDEIENTNNKQRHMLKFFFIESPHKRLHMEHYSRSYKCDTYVNMAKDILERHAGISSFNHFETNSEILQYFYTGLKTPAQCVEWLLSRASSDTTGQPGFLLYSSTESDGNPYNLRTLEAMLQQGNLMPPYTTPEYYSIHSRNQYDINKIIKYNVGRPDQKSLERMMSYVNLGFDIKRKRYLKNIYTYEDALARFTCLGSYSLFDVGWNAILSSAQELSAEVEEEKIMKNIYFGDWIKRYCLQHTVSVIVEGHVDRYCGGMIKILWPTSSDNELFDKNMDGLYLVKSITHSFSPLQKPVYNQKMILIKNGYDDSDGTLTKAAKINKSAVVPTNNTITDSSVRGV